MSQENVEIVRRAVQASTAQPPDFGTVNALYHPEHVLTSDWGAEGHTYHGASGFAEARGDLDAAWQQWRHEVDDVLDAGGDDVVVPSASWRGARRAAYWWSNSGRWSSR